MATLTETAYIARQTIKFGLIGLASFIVIRSSYLGIKKWYIKTHPKPPPPPNTAFGKLPALKFPERKNLPMFNFKLETVTGGFPIFEKQTKVFFMPQPSVNLFALEKATSWANSMGFNQEPTNTGEFDLHFTNESAKTTLDLNYLKRNFILSYDWKNDPSITAQGNPPTEIEASAIAKSYLEKHQVLTSDLKYGTTLVIYLKYSEGNLTETNRFEANLAKINIFRQDITVEKDATGKETKIPILSDNPREANVWLLISPTLSQNEGVAEVHYQDFPISLEKFATYPMVDINQAWSELLAGKGYIANLGNNLDGNIIIRRVYLAYYDSRETQYFLQPVFVFEGDRDFFAYIPAIEESWTVK